MKQNNRIITTIVKYNLNYTPVTMVNGCNAFLINVFNGNDNDTTLYYFALNLFRKMKGVTVFNANCYTQNFYVASTEDYADAQKIEAAKEELVNLFWLTKREYGVKAAEEAQRKFAEQSALYKEAYDLIYC